MYIKHIKKFKRNRFFLVFLILALFLVLVLGRAYNKVENQVLQEESKLKKYAQQVISQCSVAEDTPSCYDREIPKLMDRISMEDAFRVTSFVQEKDPNYYYCHVLGHNISAREVSKDPSKWKNVLARCPSGMCSNGCLHGGMQERFRAESLTEDQIEKAIPDLQVVCEKREGFNPTDLEQASCYHALGHLMMYMTNADAKMASEICEQVAAKSDGRNFLQTCYEGNFMQIFQPIEPEDFALVEGKVPKKEELASFCGKFEEEKKEACWREGWPLFEEELMTPDGLVEFCTRLTPHYARICYNHQFYRFSAQVNFDEARIERLCQGLPAEVKGQCFANSASRMVETDSKLLERAAGLCNKAEEYGVGDRCYKELSYFALFNFHPDSEGFYKLCNTLPGQWRQKCLNKEIKYAPIE